MDRIISDFANANDLKEGRNPDVAAVPETPLGVTEREVANAIQTLQKLVQDSRLIESLTDDDRVSLFKYSGMLSRPARDDIRIRNRVIDRARRHRVSKKDRIARAKTGIREARRTPVFAAPAQIAPVTANIAAEDQKLLSPRNCYVCKAEFDRLHFFYDSMCPACADINYRKRFQSAPLHGRVALITGSRLKIGYQATLMLLRAGARVIATTRFPVDSANRFAQEADFPQWKDRLEVYGLDLRHIPSVEIFARYIEHTYERLDILINNAAQTVRRPPGFYKHMLELESLPHTSLAPDAQALLAAHDHCLEFLQNLQGRTQIQGLSSVTDLDTKLNWNGLSPGVGIRSSAALSQIPYSIDHLLPESEIFPEGKFDQDLQQIDLREHNSWRFKLAEVPTAEMLEVQLVNAVAPFVLCSRLTPLMRRDDTGEKHIVNVTAMEGKFHRFTKSDRHPHTNMAKAALNMLTHTSASDLAKDGIFMNAVDTGWVTDEDPAHLADRKTQVHDFQPPLDIVDGAARVCDPFFYGILTGHHWSGKFLKDYMPTDW